MNNVTVTDYGHAQLINLDDPATHNYLLAEYDTQHQQPVAVVVANALAQQQQQQQQLHNHQPHQQQAQHIITKDGLVYEQLDYSYPTATASTSPAIGTASTIATATIGAASPAGGSLPVTPPHQQHFKKKIQARSTPAAAVDLVNLDANNATVAYKPPAAQPPDQILQSPPPQQQQPAAQTTGGRGRGRNATKFTVAEPLPHSSPPPAQLLAIIANPDDLEDLSHLDSPVYVPLKTGGPMRSKQSDYIESYCSFLKSRTHTK